MSLDSEFKLTTGCGMQPECCFTSAASRPAFVKRNQGLIKSIPHPSKSPTLRVTTAAAFNSAITATRASNFDTGRPFVLFIKGLKSPPPPVRVPQGVLSVPLPRWFPSWRRTYGVFPQAKPSLLAGQDSVHKSRRSLRDLSNPFLDSAPVGTAIRR